jgi:hypothetical protein
MVFLVPPKQQKPFVHDSEPPVCPCGHPNLAQPPEGLDAADAWQKGYEDAWKRLHEPDGSARLDVERLARAILYCNYMIQRRLGGGNVEIIAAASIIAAAYAAQPPGGET